MERDSLLEVTSLCARGQQLEDVNSETARDKADAINGLLDVGMCLCLYQCDRLIGGLFPWPVCGLPS